MRRPREDWEYVSMENYSNDMSTISKQASHIIAEQAKEVRQLKHLIAAMVHSVGRIEIPNIKFMDMEALPIERHDRPDIDCTVFIAVKGKP